MRARRIRTAPAAPAADPFGDIDLGLLDEAASMMDDVQNALSAVAGLADLLSGAADFGNPTNPSSRHARRLQRRKRRRGRHAVDTR